jgi:hypothetical protein
LVSITVFAWLVVFSGSMPKSTAVGDKVATGAVGVGATPAPLNATLCGLPVAVDTTVTLPAYAATLAGAKLTLIAQLALAASEARQVCVTPKPVPLGVIDVMPRLALPVLVSVIVFAALVVPVVWLPNVRLVGFNVTAGAGAAVPLPVNATLCGLPAALDGMPSVALRAVSAAGVKVTLIVQFAPGATDAPLQFVDANSPALVPVTVIVPRVRVALPVFEIATVFAALVVPTTWLLNASVVVVRAAAGVGADTPVPVRLTVLVAGDALWPIVTVALRTPMAIGLNTALTVHDCAGASASAAAQVPLRAKSPACVPPSVTDDSTRFAVPLLVSVAVIVAELVCTTWLPNASVAEVSVAAGLGVPAAGFAM